MSEAGQEANRMRHTENQKRDPGVQISAQGRTLRSLDPADRVQMSAHIKEGNLMGFWK